MTGMELFLCVSAVILLCLVLLVLIRGIIGPTIMDRLVAVNVIGTKTIVILLITGMLFHRIDMFVDIAIAYGLLNFIVSIAAARFFQHYKQMEPKADE